MFMMARASRLKRCLSRCDITRGQRRKSRCGDHCAHVVDETRVGVTGADRAEHAALQSFGKREKLQVAHQL